METKEPIAVRSLTPPTIKGVSLSKGKKIKVLWYSDFLRPTGFGNVAEAIISRLQKTGKYEFEVLGINHHGAPYNVPGSRYYGLKDIPVWPCLGNDESHPLGYGKLAKMLHNHKFDIFFSLQDAFNMVPIREAIEDARTKKAEAGVPFSYVFYFPVDGDVRKEWVDDGIAVADWRVTYTNYGVRKVQEVSPETNMHVVYHGVDLQSFYPFASKDSDARRAFRAKAFGADDKSFVISNVNRNQPRKDLPRTIIAFARFIQMYPETNPILYLHCDVGDSAGHNISEFVRSYVPEQYQNRVIVPDPKRLRSNDGFDIEYMRGVYAGSDLVTSTTTGEGWGLSTTEAMACKTPVVMPGNSATIEIVGENNERGYLAKSGADASLWFTQKYDNEIARPLTDVEDLVRLWKHVYDNPQEAAQKAEEAYDWVQKYTWDKMAVQWDMLFTDAYNALKK